MNITTNQLDRVTHDWSAIAGEAVVIDASLSDSTGSTLYACGSELACLRLFYRLKIGRIGYSVNLKTWYYTNAKGPKT